ncbi:Penicillin-binding protein 4* [Posidoniimonas polymericola]|uniref:Penicillin-binding protein 4 n=1 Tax=Posidoniimonas polymericola TaxID=2528002 RepID=A0A5C5ZDS9_9BACT|nr:serine hydrolase domain-containing protein [Posidoniimonas polymericola]TWT85320.1 Penicillin-binding protein 4* [Posidoniimonas polymericola]
MLSGLIMFNHLPANAESSQDAAAHEIEALLPPHVGAAVVAIDGGRVTFQHCWGRRRVDSPEPVTPATCFRMASVSKQFTATAVLTLVDRGQVKLTDTLDQFFYSGPEYWQGITVRHLLTHTSGLPDYESLVPAGTTLQVSDYNVLAMLADADQPKFAAGSRFAYSNSGYTLLGLIVEQSSGRQLHDFLRTEVFGPAGMPHTINYLKGMNQISERAYGHERAGGQWRLADQSVTSAVRGDGSVYSSLNDLAHWVQALDSRRVLSPESLRAATSPQVQSDRGEESYGYGWFVGDYRGERRVWHSGTTQGFALMLQRFPDRKAAVVVLLNASRADSDGEYAERVVDRLLFADAGRE